jgi:hypothetical protein
MKLLTITQIFVNIIGFFVFNISLYLLIYQHNMRVFYFTDLSNELELSYSFRQTSANNVTEQDQYIQLALFTGLRIRTNLMFL